MKRQRGDYSLSNQDDLGKEVQPRMGIQYHPPQADQSINSRLKSIEENREKIKARLNQLEGDYVPSSFSQGTGQSDVRRRTNVDSFHHGSRIDKLGPSSNDLDQVQIGSSGLRIQPNPLREEHQKILGLITGKDGQKPNIYQLNSLRQQINQKQDLLMKRKLIYRQMQATAPDQVDNVMEMDANQVNANFSNFEFDIDQYRNPIPKELLLKELPKIQKNTEQRLRVFRGSLPVDNSKDLKYNKRVLDQTNPQTVDLCREIVDQIIDSAAGYYEGLSHKLGLDQQGQTGNVIKDRVLGVKDLVVHGVYSKIVRKILKQFNKETYEEVASLEQLAQQKMTEIFGSMLGNTDANFTKEVMENYKFQLEYTSKEQQQSQGSQSESQNSEQQGRQERQSEKGLQSQSKRQNPNKKQLVNNSRSKQVGKLNKSKKGAVPKDQVQDKKPEDKGIKKDRGNFKKFYKNKIERGSKLRSKNRPASQANSDSETEGAESDQLTHQTTIQLEKEYFNKVKSEFVRVSSDAYDSKMLLIEDGLYLIGDNSIRNIQGEVIVPVPFSKFNSLKKFNKYWAVSCPEEAIVASQWMMERFGAHIGDRPYKPAGNICCVQFYPVTTLVGTVCSILIGYQNGTLLKYNLNRNPINGEQKSTSFLQPIVLPRQMQFQAPLPQEYKHMLPSTATGHKDRHQFREFMDFHTKPIVGINFFSIVECITVDSGLSCAIWSCIDENTSPLMTFTLNEDLSFYLPGKQNSTNMKTMEDPKNLYKRLFEERAGLDKQVFNKEQGIAYYLLEKPSRKGNETGLQVVQYKGKQVTSMEQQFFQQRKCNTTAVSTLLWNSNLYVLTVRQHPIEPDSKSVRVVCYNIYKKYQRKTHYQMHIKLNEQVPYFLISDSVIQSKDESTYCPALFMMNPGKIVIFSLLTGQVIKTVTDPQIQDDPLTFNHFTTAPNTSIVLTGDQGIFRMIFGDKNSQSDRQAYFSRVNALLRKYLN